MNTLTVQEAATLIGVRPQRIRELIHKGQLTANKHKGRWTIDLPTANQYARHHAARLDPNLLDAKQAANYANTTPAIILRWARHGKLPIANTRRETPNTGRPKYLFRPADIDALRNHHQKPL